MPAACWICACCAAVEYEWIVPDQGPGSETGVRDTRIFVRPSFANFAPVELRRMRVAGSKRVHYRSRLLVPPGQHYHIFESEQGSARELLVSTQQPVVGQEEAELDASQRAALEELIHTRRKPRTDNDIFRGAQPPQPLDMIHVAALVQREGFRIPENRPDPEVPPEDIDPWAELPARAQRLRQCIDADFREMHMSDLCRASEEEEVKQTWWELYSRYYYETYAIYAGRSQWPLIRQVDIYSFFDDAQMLDRGPLFGSLPPPEPGAPPEKRLSVQDVNQILLRAVATKKKALRDNSHARRIVGGSEVLRRSEEGRPINRPQFLEVLARAALIYFGGGESSMSAVLRKFAEDILGKRILVVPLTPFPRMLAMASGEYFDILLARRRTIHEAWERFGGGESAFQALTQLMRLCDNHFTAKHVASIYAVSRRPVVDCRQASQRSPGLRYDEFCEALSRLGQCWQKARSICDGPRYPPQLQPGKPVREKVLASRLERFFAKLEERMRPSFVMNV